MVNRIGEQFGRYRLIQRLGWGGFAEVYLGEHVILQARAAVKVLYEPLGAREAQDFLQEARILASLEHPNIVDIREFAIENGVPFLVMNYAPNGTLRQRYAQGQRIPLETVIAYVQQVASALQYAHDRRIVHHDLKPENMLITNNDSILLSDFGIAALYSSTYSYTSNKSAGTYAYMAPEQIMGKPCLASDQYALGVIIYEWLSGLRPFHGSVPELCAHHLYSLPPPLQNISPSVEQVIGKALSKDPSQRFASVQAFAHALAQAATLESKGPRTEIRANALIEVPIVTVFYIYAHEDELLRNELEKHLSLLKRQGRVDAWHDRNISAGAEWAQQIDTHLNTASIILLLISPDFISSDYCYSVEMTRALERHDAKEACVIPIILRPVDWQSAPFGKLQALPPEGKPITLWSDRDEAFLEIIRGIRRTIQVYLQMVLLDQPPPRKLRMDKPQQPNVPVWNHPWNSVGAAGPLISALAAAKQWEQVESEIRIIPDRQSRTRALEIFTTVLIEVQEWARAEAVVRSIEDYSRKARLLRDLGGKLAQAQEWGRAESVVRSIPDDRSRQEALVEQGQLLILAGELARAREVFRAASEITMPVSRSSSFTSGTASSSALPSRLLELPSHQLPHPTIRRPYYPTQPAENRRSRRRIYGILVLIAFGLLAAIVILMIPSLPVTWKFIVIGLIVVIVIGITAVLRILRNR